YSLFSPGPRIFGALTYSREFFAGSPTSVSVYFDGRSAGDSGYVFSGDMNNDGANNNDLIYVPRNTREMNFVPLTVGSTTYTPAQQAAAWDAFITQDSYLNKRRGGYAERNAVFRPMVYRADLSISQDVGRSIAGRPPRGGGFVYVLVFFNSHTAAPPNNRFGNHAANVGGSTPPAPTALLSWNMRRSMNVVARHTATPQAAPLLGVEIASGAPNSAMMMHVKGIDSLSACSTCSLRVSEPERASASM